MHPSSTHSRAAGERQSPGKSSDNPHGFSWTILRTYAAIIGIVLINVAIAAFVFSALHVFDGAHNKAVQPSVGHAVQSARKQQAADLDSPWRLGNKFRQSPEDHLAEARLTPEQQEQEVPSAAATQSWAALAAAPGSMVTSYEKAATIMEAASPILAPLQGPGHGMHPDGMAPNAAPVSEPASASGPAATTGLTALAGPSGAPAAQGIVEAANPEGASIVKHAEGARPEDEEGPDARLAHAEPEHPLALGDAPVSAVQYTEREEDVQGGEEAASVAGPAFLLADRLPAEAPALHATAASTDTAEAGAAHEEQAAATAASTEPAAAPDTADDGQVAPEVWDEADAEHEEAARQVSDPEAQAEALAGKFSGAEAERPADSTSLSLGEEGTRLPDEAGKGAAQAHGEARAVEGGNGAEGMAGGGSGTVRQAMPWLRFVSKAEPAGDSAIIVPEAVPAEDGEGFASVTTPDGLQAEGGGLSPAGAELEAASREAERGKGPNPQELEDWAARGVPRGSMPAPAPAPALAPDLCAQALGVPKVAMLFLSRGDLFHEATWALWFRHAAGLLPLGSLREGTCTSPGGGQASQGGCACSQERVDLAVQACGAEPRDVLGAQHLFSVYVHPLPEFGAFPASSIFAGHEIADRIEVSWGAFELVLAARNLLAAALADPLNLRMIMLSESGVPLYPPAATYAQLMAEDKSRMDSCGIRGTDLQRSSGRMAMRVRQHWRKSSQWFSLQRRHAELTLADTDVLDQFRRFCYNDWDPDLNGVRNCFADEHYMPSLLAYLQLGNETDCVGGLIRVDWSTGDAHPYSFQVEDVTAERIAGLREVEDYCTPDTAIRTSAGVFVRISELSRPAEGGGIGACPAHGVGFNSTALGYDCPLFARKFPRETASAVLDLFASCNSGLSITTDDGDCKDASHDGAESEDGGGTAHTEEPAAERGGLETYLRRDLRENDPVWIEDWL